MKILRYSLTFIVLFAHIGLISCGTREDWPELMSRIEYKKGVTYQFHGNLKKAGEAFNKAIFYSPKQADAYLGRGHV